MGNDGTNYADTLSFWDRLGFGGISTVDASQSDIQRAFSNVDTSASGIGSSGQLSFDNAGAVTPNSADQFTIGGMNTTDLKNIGLGGAGLLSGLWNIYQGKETIDILKDQEARAKAAFNYDMNQANARSNLRF